MIYIKDYTRLVYYPYQAATQTNKQKKKKNLNLNSKHKKLIKKKNKEQQ